MRSHRYIVLILIYGPELANMFQATGKTKYMYSGQSTSIHFIRIDKIADAAYFGAHVICDETKTVYDVDDGPQVAFHVAQVSLHQYWHAPHVCLISARIYLKLKREWR